METMEELEQMREQFAALNKRLEQERIINRRYIHSAIKSRTSKIRRVLRIELLNILFVMTFGAAVFYQLNFSHGFIIATEALMIVALIYTFYSCADFIGDSLFDRPMTEIIEQTMRTKRLEQRWLYFGIPAVIVWFAYFVFEAYNVAWLKTSEYFIYGCIFGLIMGGFIGIRMFLYKQRSYRAIVKNLRDLKDE